MIEVLEVIFTICVGCLAIGVTVGAIAMLILAVENEWKNR